MLVPTELSSVDWDEFRLERLAGELREDLSGPEAERMIFAFEEALRLARSDEELCLTFWPRRRACSPR